jgi:hypothetical protein
MMGVIDQAEITEVFGRVGGWPEESRRLLMEMIRRTLDEGTRPVRSDGVSCGLHGLFKTGAPPPTDEDCRRILEEELIRKHVR